MYGVVLCADDVSDAAFTPDAKALVVGSFNRENPLTRCTPFDDLEPVPCRLSLALPPKVVTSPKAEAAAAPKSIKVKSRLVGVAAVAVSPRGEFMLAGGEDHIVYIIDSARAQDGPVAVFRMESKVKTLTYITVQRGINAGGSETVDVNRPPAGAGAGAGAGASVLGPSMRMRRNSDANRNVTRRGCVGIIVGGDERGKVYLLRLFDLGNYLVPRLVPTLSMTVPQPFIPSTRTWAPGTRCATVLCLTVGLLAHPILQLVRLLGTSLRLGASSGA